MSMVSLQAFRQTVWRDVSYGFHQGPYAPKLWKSPQGTYSQCFLYATIAERLESWWVRGMEHHTTPHETPLPPLLPEYEYIVRTPGVCGGKPRIDGHRIRVQDVAVWHERRGYTPEEIVIHYPQLSLAKVYAALAYYFDHRDEIQQHIQDAETLVEEMKKRSPSPLQQKLAARDIAGHSLPPG
jgi:uncharacterized protein (DUF433 family)